MNTTIKIALAVLLLLCWLKLPYGYFQFLRIGGCIAFAWLAYIELEGKRNVTGMLCIVGAILLNPIVKIHFDRYTWNVIDTIIGVLLIIWAIIDLYLHYGKSSKESQKAT